jgi:hypothetical protein
MAIPITITTAGLQPAAPAALRARLLAGVAAVRPGYTATLPGSLIEDVSSTDVAALVVSDSALVELVNSITPFGANAFILRQLGNIYGVPLGIGSNTSVYVVFTGDVGFPIPKGFTVSDGTYQYVVQEGGIIASGGSTNPLFALASLPGTWVVPAGTVNDFVTSVPNTITLSVSNPLAGTPGSATGQSEEDYRAQVVQAGLAASQGMPRYLKTILGNVAGVQKRLISVRAATGATWEVIVGGGDPYQVADAIFTGLFDISSLVGSTIGITGITNANPGVVTTDLNHGLVSTQNNVHIADVLGMTAANGGPYTVTVITEKTFSFGVDTTGFGVYTSGGVVTPNARNVSVEINDYPDTYTIPFVIPPQQTVTMTITWNTTSPFSVSPTVVAQIAAQPLVDYINSIPVGAPINVLSVESVFRDAIAGTLPPEYLTRIVVAVDINGISTAPTAGTVIIPGDPESYFFAQVTGITVTQG